MPHPKFFWTFAHFKKLTSLDLSKLLKDQGFTSFQQKWQFFFGFVLQAPFHISMPSPLLIIQGYFKIVSRLSKGIFESNVLLKHFKAINSMQFPILSKKKFKKCLKFKQKEKYVQAYELAKTGHFRRGGVPKHDFRGHT